MSTALKREIDNIGYTVVKGVLGERERATIVAEYEELLDRLARDLFAQGRLTSAFDGLPTGRDEFPSLIVRSRQHPDSVQDYAYWRDSWLAARDRLGSLIGREPTHRWDGAAEACA